MGWTVFGSRAGAGTADDLSEADLPGVLAGIRTHDGPPFGQLFTRPVIVQNSAARTWAAVARIAHPGIGLAEAGERDRMGAGLAELCEIAARTELIDVLALQVRTVPDDGAERAAWERAHARPDAAAAGRAGERAAGRDPHAGRGADRGLRDRRRRRAPDRPGGEGVRRRAWTAAPGSCTG